MRVLSNQDNRFTVFDGVSNTKVTLFYRVPNTEEIIDYHSKLYTRTNNKVEFNQKTRINGALKVITGIGDKCFGDEEGKAISHNLDSPDYNKDWKELLEKYASDILLLLGIQVFETTRVTLEEPADPLAQK